MVIFVWLFVIVVDFGVCFESFNIIVGDLGKVRSLFCSFEFSLYFFFFFFFFLEKGKREK